MLAIVNIFGAARAVQWENAGSKVTVIHQFAGGEMPAVLLDGTAIAAQDFLAKSIDPKPPASVPALSNSENLGSRRERISRLKLASTLNECPDFEFLAECWQDVLLQTQIKSLIAKYPQWGIIVDSVGQLQVDF